jgi:hypothetical protein
MILRRITEHVTAQNWTAGKPCIPTLVLNAVTSASGEKPPVQHRSGRTVTAGLIPASQPYFKLMHYPSSYHLAELANPAISPVSFRRRTSPW